MTSSVYYRKVNAEEAKARIEKARNKRLLRSKLDGQTLGDLDQDETSLGGASNWVERSRQKAEELKRKKEKETAAEALAKRLQEEEEVINDSMNSYSAKDLQGVEVLHAESNFVEGESIILTLADSNILETNERGQVLGLNTDNDVLENINMTEEEKRLDREKKKKRLRQPIYSGYDDAEFEEGTASGKKPNILSQYDKEKKRGPQMRLGEGGQVVSNNTGNDELGNSRKAIPQSLQVEKANTSLAEYLTPAEYATFSKSKKDKVKKKRKIRKKETSSGLIEELEAALDVEKGDAAKGADRGSRISSGETTLSRLRAQENDRRQAYQNAAKIANEKTSGLAVSEPSLAEMKESEEDIDDDADIVQSLERARRLALSKKSAKPKLASSCHEDEILEQIRNGENVGHIYTDGTVKVLPTTSSTNNKMEISNGGGEQDDDFVDAEGRRKDGTLVFTSTTEFTTRLQAHLQEKARSKSAAVIKEMELAGAGTGDVDSDEEVGEHNIRMGDVEKRKGGWVELEDASDDEGGIRMGQHSPIPNQKRLDQDDNDEGENTGFGAQPVVARGMAATLELLKGTGDLKKKKELAGRAKDAREQDPSAEDVGVKLEYRDEFGRKMTQKEAFRQLSYRFHGIQPGKKKKAKRLQVCECDCFSLR